MAGCKEAKGPHKRGLRSEGRCERRPCMIVEDRWQEESGREGGRRGASSLALVIWAEVALIGSGH